MSRTDRHRPWNVQLADLTEQRWRFVGGSWWPYYRLCNCRQYGCSGGWRKFENRQKRHQVQRLAREALKGADWD